VVTLGERNVRYAIIGGQAQVQHARVRTIDDIDPLLTVSRMKMAGYGSGTST